MFIFFVQLVLALLIGCIYIWSVFVRLSVNTCFQTSQKPQSQIQWNFTGSFPWVTFYKQRNKKASRLNKNKLADLLFCFKKKHLWNKFCFSVITFSLVDRFTLYSHTMLLWSRPLHWYATLWPSNGRVCIVLKNIHLCWKIREKI